MTGTIQGRRGVCRRDGSARWPAAITRVSPTSLPLCVQEGTDAPQYLVGDREAAGRPGPGPREPQRGTEADRNRGSPPKRARRADHVCPHDGTGTTGAPERRASSPTAPLAIRSSPEIIAWGKITTAPPSA